jgi:hypothetical protein
LTSSRRSRDRRCSVSALDRRARHCRLTRGVRVPRRHGARRGRRAAHRASACRTSAATARSARADGAWIGRVEAGRAVVLGNVCERCERASVTVRRGVRHATQRRCCEITMARLQGEATSWARRDCDVRKALKREGVYDPSHQRPEPLSCSKCSRTVRRRGSGYRGVDETPVLARLVVDAESVSCERELDPARHARGSLRRRLELGSWL